MNEKTGKSRRKVLLTGATGFIGRNLKDLLEAEFALVAPNREELNLLDNSSVEEYLASENFFSVLHFANPSPAKNRKDKLENMLRDSLRCYFSLRRSAKHYNRMFFLGSGAEYDKTKDLKLVSEDKYGCSIPKDDYGLAKYIMTQDAKLTSNVYNLRIFGCFGPTDAVGKFIRDCIDSCLLHRPITITQDCYFDYMYVTDLFYVIRKMMDAKLNHHDYNVCTGIRISLKKIAQIIKLKMGNPYPIIVNKDGFKNEYTGSNDRLLSEIPNLQFTPIEEGIEKQILWQIQNFNLNKM